MGCSANVLTDKDLVRNMEKSKPASIAQTAVPSSDSSLARALSRVHALAPPPLFPGEKAADYSAIASGIVKVSRPRDAIEEFLIRDIIDHTWEIQRNRRAKAAIVRASLGDGVRGILAGIAATLLSTPTARGIRLVSGGRPETRVREERWAPSSPRQE